MFYLLIDGKSMKNNTFDACKPFTTNVSGRIIFEKKGDNLTLRYNISTFNDNIQKKTSRRNYINNEKSCRLDDIKHLTELNNTIKKTMKKKLLDDSDTTDIKTSDIDTLNQNYELIKNHKKKMENLNLTFHYSEFKTFKFLKMKPNTQVNFQGHHIAYIYLKSNIAEQSFGVQDEKKSQSYKYYKMIDKLVELKKDTIQGNDLVDNLYVFDRHIIGKLETFTEINGCKFSYDIKDDKLHLKIYTRVKEDFDPKKFIRNRKSIYYDLITKLDNQYNEKERKIEDIILLTEQQGILSLQSLNTIKEEIKETLELINNFIDNIHKYEWRSISEYKSMIIENGTINSVDTNDSIDTNDSVGFIRVLPIEYNNKIYTTKKNYIGTIE